MSSQFRTFLIYSGAVGLIVLAIFTLIHEEPSIPSQEAGSASEENAQTASVLKASLSSIPPTPTKEKVTSPPSGAGSKASQPQHPTSSTPVDQTTYYVKRIQNLYSFSQKPFLEINKDTGAALLNILCTADEGALRPVSGSAVVIDPRGVILTNAHVAQYVLLAESNRTNLSCVARSGSPAVPLWTIEVLYIPPVWIREHAADITNASPTGTGEHDYALLRITGAWNVEPSPTPFEVPALPIDTREGIGFVGDQVLAASYPAEFVGGGAQHGLYPVSSIAPIKELLTFESKTVDLLSLGGIVEAQSGSSGGPMVNAWGRLIGIITTTSEGTTTAERELHATTLSYISRDLAAQTGSNLDAILSGDLAAEVREFNAKYSKQMSQLLIDQIAKHAQ